MKKYLSTAEFANLVGTTKDTLFHYDRTGIFKPDFIADNGYRYYNPRQAFWFSDIKILQKNGFELSEIKSFFDSSSTGQYKSLLEQQIEHTRNEIALLERNYQRLKDSLDNLNDATSVHPEFQIINQNAIYGVRTEQSSLPPETHFYNFLKMKNSLDDLFKDSVCMALRLSSELTESGIPDAEYVYSEALDSSAGNEIVRPAGRYLVCYHHGSDETLYLTYRKALSYIKENTLQPGGLAFEEYLVYEIATNNESEMVTKISIQLF